MSVYDLRPTQNVRLLTTILNRVSLNDFWMNSAKSKIMCIHIEFVLVVFFSVEIRNNNESNALCH